jgi:lipoate-protein ligase A
LWIDDHILERHDRPLVIDVWVPRETVVVCGSSNDPAVECNLPACLSDGVPVLKRYGGGGTVVLYPGCVIVSLGMWVTEHFHNDRYFRLLNSAVNSCLHAGFAFDAILGEAGISDLVAGDMKFGGTSLFRSRNYLLYQASLIIDCDRPMISKYLAHPSREPGYRRGRAHGSFLTGLAEIGRGISVASVEACLLRGLAGHVLGHFGEQAFGPQPNQFSALQARIERSRLELRK